MKLRRQRDDNVEINLISLIDVLLFLVIFFMVSTTFVERAELAINLPKATAEAPTLETNKVEIAIDATGRYFINGSALINTQLATLKQALSQVVRDLREPVVIINADAKSSHQSVITALDAARQLGLMRITFAIETPEGEADAASH